MDILAKRSLGYQVTHGVFDTTSINNAGDPFSKKKSYLVNTLREEKELVEYYAHEILNIKEPIWGYCASGSTESILNALWMARNRFPLATIYASRDCHFCVPKIAEMLCMRLVLVDTVSSDGRMNMLQLFELLNQETASTAIVVLTMGTTIRNAYDNIAEFYEKIASKLISLNIHVHVDGAFGGAIYPLLKPEWLNYPIHSFNVSFHKFFGCPFPCSLFITLDSVRNEIKGTGCFGKDMVCLPDKDYTISCSRNGTAVLSMYNRIVKNPTFLHDHVNTIVNCLKVKRYLIKKIHTKIDCRESNEMSLSVELLGLPRKLQSSLSKYGLNLRKMDEQRFDTHVYLCGHVSYSLIDEFVSDLTSDVCTV